MSKLLTTFSFVLAFMLGAQSASSQVVETYVANARITAAMPGTPGTGTTSFNYNFNFNTVDFAPGAVVFNGQPVDFDGTEPQWLASTENGVFTLGTTSGPTITNAQVLGQWTGPITISSLQGTASGVAVGSSFSPSFLDGVQGSGYPIQHQMSGTNLSLPPGSLSHDALHHIVAIDAVNGIVDVAVEGSFSMQAPVSNEERSWGWIKMLYGGLLLGIGSVGSGTVLLNLRRKTRVS
jgi:hypothetical protein